MLFLNKLLPVFVLPVGLMIILVVLGTLRQWRGLVFAALAAFYLACTPWVGAWLLGRLEYVHPRLQVAEAPAADAVLVLGGTMGPASPEGYLPNWSDAMERFEGGVALVQAGRAPRLLFTGGPLRDGGAESEGAAMRRLAVARGVPAEAIAVLGRVGNTADEVRVLADHAREHGLRRIILVTSAWHMPRAMRQFRAAGLEITAFPVDYHYNPDRQVLATDFLPHALHGLANTEMAMRETYGLAFYAVFGR